MRPRPLCQETLTEVLDQRIRPLLAIDGGEIVVIKLDDATGVVHLRLVGRYLGCPGRQTVLEKLVRPVLEGEIEGIVSIKLVD